MPKHCLTCGTRHDEKWCPPEAFEVARCAACGNECIQPADVGPLIGMAHCGQCGSAEKWETRPATLDDMRKHWKGYGEK